MDAQVAFQVADRTVCLATALDGAQMHRGPEMILHVVLQLDVAGETAGAAVDGTFQGHNRSVEVLVAGQVPRSREAFAAGLEPTHVGFLARVGHQVLRERAPAVERAATTRFRALVRRRLLLLSSLLLLCGEPR